MAQVLRNCGDFLTKKDQENLYEILGCDELSSKEQINKEFKKKALKFHPDKNRKKKCKDGGDHHDEKTDQMFDRLKMARDILCDESRRKQYDYWRRIGLHDYITFDQWMQKSSHMQASVHWAPKSLKKYMLTANRENLDDLCKETSKEQNQSNQPSGFIKCHPYVRTGWGGKKSHLIRKFQNYEI